MTKSLAIALALTGALTACSGDNKESVVATTPTPTATATPPACTPSESGTKDLTKKPVITIPKTPAPAETTIVDVVCGTGAVAGPGANVEVKYVGVLYDGGTEFDSSWSRGADETLPFSIGGRVIAGFSKGAEGMRVGGRREVTIPAKDGYGDQANGPIPAGATLIFVIDLVTVS